MESTKNVTHYAIEKFFSLGRYYRRKLRTIKKLYDTASKLKNVPSVILKKIGTENPSKF